MPSGVTKNNWRTHQESSTRQPYAATQRMASTHQQQFLRKQCLVRTDASGTADGRIYSRRWSAPTHSPHACATPRCTAEECPPPPLKRSPPRLQVHTVNESAVRLYGCAPLQSVTPPCRGIAIFEIKKEN